MPAHRLNHVTRLFTDRVDIPPSENAAFNTWVALDDAIGLLRADLEEDDLVLYCSTGDSFLHGVVVPTELVTPPNPTDLMHWNGNPYQQWGLVYSFDPPDVSIRPPLANSQSATLAGGEQLLFARAFEGVSEEASIELLQKLTHVFGLHFLEERSAYCRLDDNGDLENVVSITRLDDFARTVARRRTVVTIKRSVLDEYMTITNTTIGQNVRHYSFQVAGLRRLGTVPRPHSDDGRGPHLPSPRGARTR